MDSSDEFFYHHFIETSSSSSSDDDDLLIVTAILLWDAEQNALPKYRRSTRGRTVVNRVRDRADGRLLLRDDYYKPAVKTPKMAHKEHAQTSRKRVADKQIKKGDSESDDDSPEQEAEIFDKASEEVMATQRIVNVRCQQLLSTPSNPFSAIRYTPSDSSVQASTPFSNPPPCVTVSNVRGCCSSEKDAASNADSNEAAEIQKDESVLKGSNAKTKFGLKTDGPSFPAFSNGGTNNNGISVPALTTDAEAPKKFAMTLKDLEKKGVTFACINSNGELPSGLTTFALKFKDAGVREDFKAAVETHGVRKASDA